MGEILEPKIVDHAPERADLFVLGCFEGEAPRLRGAHGRTTSALERAVERRGWSGREGQLAMERSTAPGTPQLLLWGLGKKKDCSLRDLRVWLDKAARRAATDGYRQVVFVPPDHAAASGSAAAAVLLRELALTRYRFTDYRKKKPKDALRNASVLPPEGRQEVWRRAARQARAAARGIALARDLANTPPNVATPEWMAERAQSLADEGGFEALILDENELEARGMGGILAVGGGSARPPRLVRLSVGEGRRSISLVGKGVTFDTGGISIKPSSSMDEMKFDKCGACTVMGVARAVQELDLPLTLRFYLPLAENMPDGRAYRPGDIVRCYNGKSVEVLNTDAEGRMILADALSWAAEEKPDHLLDYATLTGACVVALGRQGAGLFADDDDLASGLLDAAVNADEYLWRLPLWPEFGKSMRGQHGDLRNVAGRWGGASTAAAFLSEFVGQRSRWAHLDIAGPAYVGRDQSGSFGATGYGVALTVSWLLRQAELASE